MAFSKKELHLPLSNTTLDKLRLELNRAEATVRQIAVNDPVVITELDSVIQLVGSTDAVDKAMTVASTYAGHVVSFDLVLRSSTGNYEMTIDEGDFTLNATDEKGTIYYDGTLWRYLNLQGATIV